MLARRGSQILAFTKRDAVRLGFLSALLVAGLTFVLALGDLTTVTEPVDLLSIFGWLLLSIAVVTTLMAWLWRFRSRLWHRNNAILLISLALLTATALLVITGDNEVAPFLVPTFAVGLLLSVLLDSGVASVLTAMVAIMAGVITGSMDLAAYTFLGGLAGTIVIGRGERLSQFVQAGAAITAANIAVVVAFTIIARADDLEIFLQLLAASAISAFGAAVAAAGTFAVLGSLFGITTSYQLLELANPTQPLLRRLLLEAPGTYHHSLMVGNLAEQAAEAIGADALVTRVAAYYHDVGKLYDPMVFIENQAGGENLHDQLPPEESAAIDRRPRGPGHRHRLPVQAAQGAHPLHPPASRHRLDGLLLRQGLPDRGRGGRVDAEDGGRQGGCRPCRPTAVPPRRAQAADARGGHPHAGRQRRSLGTLAGQPRRAGHPGDGLADHR